MARCLLLRVHTHTCRRRKQRFERSTAYLAIRYVADFFFNAAYKNDDCMCMCISGAAGVCITSKTCSWSRFYQIKPTVRSKGLTRISTDWSRGVLRRLGVGQGEAIETLPVVIFRLSEQAFYFPPSTPSTDDIGDERFSICLKKRDEPHFLQFI